MTGEMSRPAPTRTDIAYQVSNISRPKMPLIVSIEWMTRSQSNWMSPDGSPSSATSPPCAIDSIIECSAAGRAGHLQPDVEALDHAEVAHDVVEGGRA